MTVCITISRLLAAWRNVGYCGREPTAERPESLELNPDTVMHSPFFSLLVFAGITERGARVVYKADVKKVTLSYNPHFETCHLS
jgi:hypothetical protein